MGHVSEFVSKMFARGETPGQGSRQGLGIKPGFGV